jgi:hypothetical protein
MAANMKHRPPAAKVNAGPARWHEADGDTNSGTSIAAVSPPSTTSDWPVIKDELIFT